MADIFIPKDKFLEKYYYGSDDDNPIIGMIVKLSEIKDKLNTYSGSTKQEFYAVRICSGNPPDLPDDQTVPVQMSGFKPESTGRSGQIGGRLQEGDFVRLIKHKRTGEYLITGSIPVCAGTTLSTSYTAGICQSVSGYAISRGRISVPLSGQAQSGGNSINEFAYGHPDASKLDTAILAIPTIQLKTPCEPSSMAGVPSAMSGLLKDVQDLRTGLLGNDSFLVTSQNFVNEVQSKVDNVASMMAGAISWLIQEIKKQIMRLVNTVVNNTVGNLYLNTRYAIYEQIDIANKAINCAIMALLDTLAQFIADALNNFINDIINPAACAIENFLSSILSEIANGILGAISGILAGIGSIIGAAINVVDTILGVVESLLNIFEGCPPRQVCPADEEWNFLEGVGGAGGISIDIEGIFSRVNDAIDAGSGLVSAVTSFPSTFDGFDFNLDAGAALASAGGCFVGPSPCGPPTVRFFGGGAVRDAIGRAVVSRTGSVLGIEITDPGSGYRSSPMMVIDDPCGLGIGARGIAEIGPVGVASTEPGGGPSSGGTGGPGGGTGSVPCTYSRDIGYTTPGIYLDLMSVSSSVTVPFFATKESANDYVVNIPGVRSFNRDDAGVREDYGGIAVDLKGGRIYGPCVISSGPGTLYVGNQVVPGIRGSGSLSNSYLVVADGTDDWNDFVIQTGRGFFIDLTDCTRGGLGSDVGITTVPMISGGYGYLPGPDGSRGAVGRVYGGRCQTLVQRVNGTWDPPYDPGAVITLETGDRISLPALSEIELGDAVIAPELTRLGARLVRINPPLATVPYRSMVGFDDSKGTPPEASGWFSMDDYNEAKKLGFTDSDIRFYLETNYIGKLSPKVESMLNNPDFGRRVSGAPRGYYGIRQMFGFDDSAWTSNFFGYIRDYQEAKRRGFSDADIRYYLENHYTGTIGPRMIEALKDPNFGKIQGISNMGGVPFGKPKDMRGFSDAFGDAGAFGNLDYQEARRLGYTDADIRYYLENDYKGIIGARMRTKLSDPAWGRIQIDRAFSDTPGEAGSFGIEDLEQALRQDETDNAFLSGDATTPDNTIYNQAIQEGYTEADVRYYLENYYKGTISPAMRARLDDPTWGRELPVIGGPNVPAPPPIRNMVGVFSDSPGRKDEFSNADVDAARSEGFRDVDIRFYLENNYTGYIADGVKRLLSDPNWGRLGQTITVSVTAPGCPDDIVSDGDAVVPYLAGAMIADPGFGYDCSKDTITVRPDRGARLEYECVKGSISAVRVVDGGSGFTEMPEIIINSDTGYNARIFPVLGFVGIGTEAIGAGTTFIKVVDCVGTIPPKRPLDIVPE